MQSPSSQNREEHDSEEIRLFTLRPKETNGVQYRCLSRITLFTGVCTAGQGEKDVMEPNAGSQRTDVQIITASSFKTPGQRGGHRGERLHGRHEERSHRGDRSCRHVRGEHHHGGRG